MHRDHPSTATHTTDDVPADTGTRSPRDPGAVATGGTTAPAGTAGRPPATVSTAPVHARADPPAPEPGTGPFGVHPLAATTGKTPKPPAQPAGVGDRLPAKRRCAPQAAGILFSEGLVPTPETAGAVFAEPDTPVADRDLVDDFKAGNDEAFTRIVARHRTKLRWVARRYAKTEADAEDILQEALLAAARGLPKFRCEAKLSTWLHRIVANTGYDHINRASAVEQTVLDDAGFGRSILEMTGTEDPHPNLEWTLTLKEMLDQLPKVQRDALVLIDVAGHSVRQVAAMQGVPSGTVKSRRSRAKKFLRDKIEHTVAAPGTGATPAAGPPEDPAGHTGTDS